jgi:hypothetical protein
MRRTLILIVLSVIVAASIVSIITSNMEIKKQELMQADLLTQWDHTGINSTKNITETFVIQAGNPETNAVWNKLPQRQVIIGQSMPDKPVPINMSWKELVGEKGKASYNTPLSLEKTNPFTTILYNSLPHAQ